jgi:hypothetical protein
VESLPVLVDVKGIVVSLVAELEGQVPFVPPLGVFVVELAELEVFRAVSVVLFVLVALGEEDHSIRLTVVQRPETHRAGMGEHVDVTARERFAANALAGLADRNGLGVGRRIVRLLD